MTKFEIKTFSILNDNYIYLLINHANKKCALFDCGSKVEVLDFINVHNLSLEFIFLTHHHNDHTAAAKELELATGTTIVSNLIEFTTKPISNQKIEFIFHDLKIMIIPTPGHTARCLSYYIPDLQVIITGDFLFNAGIGRIFDGTFTQMLNSLMQLKDISKNTIVLPGHNYTKSNLLFALSVDKNNLSVKDALISLEEFNSLEKQYKINPFLRLKEQGIISNLNMEQSEEIEILQKLREMKNNFSG